MGFSLLCWNVEKFKATPMRLRRVAKHIRDHDPDVFGMLEIMNVDVLSLMQNEFPQYDFCLTDSSRGLEILVGHRRGIFDQVAFTQRREFGLYNPYLRLGALLTVWQSNVIYNVLFLHTDSGTEARDFGNRYEMFEKIWKLKAAIDKKTPGGQGRLIVMGDLNTMGLKFPSQRKAHQKVDEPDEIDALRWFAGSAGMTILSKDEDETFFSTRYQADLDHALASKNIKFKTLGTRSDASPFTVNVRGWNQIPTNDDKKKFANEISDHSSLWLEIV